MAMRNAGSSPESFTIRHYLSFSPLEVLSALRGRIVTRGTSTQILSETQARPHARKKAFKLNSKPYSCENAS